MTNGRIPKDMLYGELVTGTRTAAVRISSTETVQTRHESGGNFFLKHLFIFMLAPIKIFISLFLLLLFFNPVDKLGGNNHCLLSQRDALECVCITSRALAVNISVRSLKVIYIYCVFKNTLKKPPTTE